MLDGLKVPLRQEDQAEGMASGGGGVALIHMSDPGGAASRTAAVQAGAQPREMDSAAQQG